MTRRLTRASCGWALALGALACAHAHGAPAASGPSGVDASAFRGTAYLKTSNTVLFAGQSQGIARMAAQAQIDQCNASRQTHYQLPPVSPPESVMSTLDTTTHEKYFDTDKALTVISGSVLTLPDMQRWTAEVRAEATSGGLPAVPPDCAKTAMNQNRKGTLWREGRMYELRYDTSKAIARRVYPAPAVDPDVFLRAPKGSQLGQSCREVTGGIGLRGEGHACIWDLFPYLSYLNWPFALSGQVQFGPTAAMVEIIVPVTVEHGRAIPSSVFAIPPGFTVVGD